MTMTIVLVWLAQSKFDRICSGLYSGNEDDAVVV